MDSKPATLSWPRPSRTGRALLLAGMALLLVLAACLPAATPSPALDPTPTQTPPLTEGAQPSRPPAVPADSQQGKPRPDAGPDQGSAGGSGQAEAGQGVVVSPTQGGGVVEARPVVDQTHQWVGAVVESTLEGRHLEIKRDCDQWVLLPQSEELARKLEGNVGNKVVIWGRVFTGVSIYMRQAVSVQNAFGPNDPMVMLYVPDYPCPGTPAPKPVPPVPPPAFDLQLGELAAVGYYFWEEGRLYLDTPSGRVLLAIPPDMAIPTPTATPRPGSSSPVAQLLVLVVGKWSINNGQLAIAVRYLRPWPGPTPIDPVPPQPPPPPPITPAPPPPGQGQGTIYGRVHIGPLCPVEPCPNPTPDVYSSRALVLQPLVGEPTYVKLSPDGSFKALVNASTYTVSLTDCTFLGCRGALPKKVSIALNEAVLLEIDIDTGIR